MKFSYRLSLLFLWTTLALTLTSQATPLLFPSPQKSESFWQKILRVTGISATPRSQRDIGKPTPGQVWIANLEAGTRFRVPTETGVFMSPIFLPDATSILAIQGDRVIKILVADGSTQSLFQVKGIVKLVGMDIDDPDKVLIIADEDQDSCPSVALLSLTSGEVNTLPHSQSEEDQTLINHLQSWTRYYDDGVLELKPRKQDNFFNVFLKERNKDYVNLSKCEENVKCVQPSLSGDRKKVVFIKES